ncbi:shikimate kinase [Lentibacillus sp. CBA3610]|uniref:shikimate kinase n=1 Tax=Lentibacillus sp. CBA3610 TaxID=2518176 RepID=UPI0015956AD1|nr:shikimate kinase [Lentibacillus sp. CBA3610]QKY69317.1 shikimate kinase [Lentibacillus sp. CBA3610]
MKTLYLIGFMGSGKSTVGKLLHQQLGVSHLDTDQMVVEKYGEIASIFQREGEKQFRNYETDMLTQIPESDYIVSTGGGIVEREENTLFMKNNGRIIHLNASFAEIEHRLGTDSKRPLWGKDRSEKFQLFQARNERYGELADITMETDGKSPQDIAAEILKSLSSM